MGKTGLNDSAEAAKPAKTASNAPKGAVTDSKSFRDGLIYLYQRADFKKPTWLCRVKIPNGSGYVNRSTGTGDEHKAFKFADDLYNQLLVKSLTGEAPPGKQMGRAIQSYIERLESQPHKLSIHYKVLLLKRIKPFLERKSFDDLSTSLLSKVVDEQIALTKKGTLSPNTIKRTYTDLKHFLQWCIEEGYITQMPRFPKVNGVASSRPHFDAKDWAKLIRQLREIVKVENGAIRRDRMMLRDYVLILANTGIRVGEARTLKWRDVTEIGGGNGEAAHVTLLVSGKTGKREVVARSADIKTYFKRIHDLRVEELTVEGKPKPKIDPNSLVFCHKDGTEIGTFKKSFAALMKRAGVERDSYGNLRSLYSLRHTYATFCLQHGVAVYTLAKNMGTSVAMIEQYYGHTTNVASASELTKRVKRQASGAASSLSWLE
ncbi:tyrosine-type recombinase/integrase [Blastomonas sp. AAP53]|uniref:tyrosine-type recombinase/integrase n=1 Tax=Blastomonas sp. AAP53 TaxID=1248760 RepID=UPI0002F1945C|nr:tyrosine-type recombinase/integrase [Blastomonas sp. AAP53]